MHPEEKILRTFYNVDLVECDITPSIKNDMPLLVAPICKVHYRRTNIEGKDDRITEEVKDIEMILGMRQFQGSMFFDRKDKSINLENPTEKVKMHFLRFGKKGIFQEEKSGITCSLYSYEPLPFNKPPFRSIQCDVEKKQ